MNDDQTALMAAMGGAAALLLLVLCVLLWRTTRRLSARIDELQAGVQARLDAPASTALAEPSPYVITALDEAETGRPPASGPVVSARIDGPMFADIVARETVIKAAGLAHGLRRALSAETRNRIGFEMKREVKRSRKQRRSDMKAALRDFQARERESAVGEQDGEDAA
jgi:hypothetical protein